MSTQLSRAQLKENRTLIDLKELRNWENNPREVLDLERVKKDMKGVQTIPLLVLADGTILGGNTRYKAMLAIGKPKVWVSVVEFEEENGHIVAYINGERDIKTFRNEEDGIKHYALKSNEEYARYLDAEVVELALDTALDLEEYAFRSERGSLMTLQDVMDESDGVSVQNIAEIEEENARIDALNNSDKAKKPKIRYSLEFDYSLVKTTSHNDFEDWLNGKMDEMMLSMLDQFSEAKATTE